MNEAEPTDYAPSRANHAPLTPVGFLDRAAAVFPHHPAIASDKGVATYAVFAERARKLAGALLHANLGRGEVTAVLMLNCPELLEAHFGVPRAGGVLCALNTRLDSSTFGFILRHSGARCLIVETGFAGALRDVLAELSEVRVVWVHDGEAPVPAGGETYEAFLENASPAPIAFDAEIADEWQSLALNYTSGTTGNPKGVLLHHRGGYLNALGNAYVLGFDQHTRYLWTLPMFHCNGWTHTWAVTLAAGLHVCLRKVEASAILAAIERHKVTHLSGAPIVLGMIANAKAAAPMHARVRVATGGAAPPEAIIEKIERLGFDITHLYGMTECYGPAAVCLAQDDLSELSLPGGGGWMARQGVPHTTGGAVDVLNSETLTPVPHDGETLGELVVRGNTVMKGYFRNAAATRAALGDGWLRTGDLAVIHPDGYIQIRDRAKDIIISGGENISSLEVEEALYKHPDVLEAAVVAAPDERWGETPYAFVALRDGALADAASLESWCRKQLAGFKVPRRYCFGPLPKTATGKIQKHVLRSRAKLGD